MVDAILKAGKPVEFTLTGIKASVVAIQNDSVIFQNEKGEDIKVSIGHQRHFTGTGAWDNRPKRQRTRSAQSRAIMKEYQ